MPLMATRRVGRFLKAAFLGSSSTEQWNRYVPVDRRESGRELSVKALLLNEGVGAEDRYTGLFQYFLRSYLEYASPAFERVFYPGMGSVHGYQISGLEGFARTAPLLAAWISSGRDPAIIIPTTGESVDLQAVLRKGLLAGTNPDSHAYWGKITGIDQRTVEAADISRVLWLTREQIWTKFSVAEQNQVAEWLLGVNTAITPKNNWLLFPVVVNFVLDALGYAGTTKTEPYYPSGYY
jgi:hypothetical protein